MTRKLIYRTGRKCGGEMVQTSSISFSFVVENKKEIIDLHNRVTCRDMLNSIIGYYYYVDHVPFNNDLCINREYKPTKTLKLSLVGRKDHMDNLINNFHIINEIELILGVKKRSTLEELKCTPFMQRDKNQAYLLKGSSFWINPVHFSILTIFLRSLTLTFNKLNDLDDLTKNIHTTSGHLRNLNTSVGIENLILNLRKVTASTKLSGNNNVDIFIRPKPGTLGKEMETVFTVNNLKDHRGNIATYNHCDFFMGRYSGIMTTIFTANMILSSKKKMKLKDLKAEINKRQSTFGIDWVHQVAKLILKKEKRNAKINKRN